MIINTGEAVHCDGCDHDDGAIEFLFYGTYNTCKVIRLCEKCRNEMLGMLKEMANEPSNEMNLMELWGKARKGEKLRDEEWKLLLADWDERNGYNQQKGDESNGK